MSQLYPIFADLSGKKVVLVGGGQVGQRKVMSLLDSQAKVLVISPRLTEELARLHRQGLIDWRQRDYQKGDLEDVWLVIAAVDDSNVNQQILAEASERKILCNVVDEPQLCSFQVPAVINRGPLQIAISTGGISPALARRIREKLQEEFDESYEQFLAGLQELRQQVKKKYPQNLVKRGEILAKFVNSAALSLLKAGKIGEFRQLLDEYLKI